MTPEAQRIAIAKDDPRFRDKCSQMALALGYKYDPMRGPLNAVWHKGIESRTNPWFERYFNDLNAMHEAEKVHTMAQHLKYLSRLRMVCLHSGVSAECATASQRAEAFLRTIGKWEDDK